MLRSRLLTPTLLALTLTVAGAVQAQSTTPTSTNPSAQPPSMTPSAPAATADQDTHGAMTSNSTPGMNKDASGKGAMHQELTADQKAQVKQIFEEEQQRTHDRLSKVLSPEQMAQWDAKRQAHQEKWQQKKANGMGGMNHSKKTAGASETTTPTSSSSSGR